MLVLMLTLLRAVARRWRHRIYRAWSAHRYPHPHPRSDSLIWIACGWVEVVIAGLGGSMSWQGYRASSGSAKGESRVRERKHAAYKARRQPV